VAPDPLEIPFHMCSPACDVCKQLYLFCADHRTTHIEIQRAGGGSKNRLHVKKMLEPYGHLVTITGHSSR
jgi:hypothetical protein